MRAEWQREDPLPLDEQERIWDGQDYNFGGRLGEPSANRVDVDIDCLEAIPIAAEFLPATCAIFGRASKPRSHWLYTATAESKA